MAFFMVKFLSGLWGFPSPLFIFILSHFCENVKGFLKLFSKFLSELGSTVVCDLLGFPFRHCYYTIIMLQEKNESVTILLNRRPARNALAFLTGASAYLGHFSMGITCHLTLSLISHLQRSIPVKKNFAPFPTRCLTVTR